MINETMDGSIGFRSSMAAALLFFALFAGLWFYGVGVNLVVLLISSAALVLALILSGPTALYGSLQSPWVALLTIGTIAALIASSWSGLSPDSSFPASWVLASLPLAYLIMAGLPGRARFTLTRATIALAITLAGISSFRFFVFGERAHLPVGDPNNYGTLLYLIWIPLVHAYLWRQGSSSATPRLTHLRYFAVSFVMVSAIAATQSRTSMAVVLSAVGLWLLISLWKRRPLGSWSLQAAAAVIAMLLVMNVHPSLLDQATSVTGARDGLAIRAALFGSAFSMWSDHGWMGIGLFGFPLLYPSYRSLTDQETAGLFVHNDYLQLFVEGGPLLFAMLLVFVVSVAVRAFRMLRSETDTPEFVRFGELMAIGAACIHANVNFVLYCLPLAILLGGMTARVFAPLSPPSPIDPQHRGAAITGYSFALVFGAAAWLLLALDLAIAGVLLGQNNVPFAASVRSDQDSVLAFSRTAQRLNDQRGAPILMEAIILTNQAVAQPKVPALAAQALAAHRRAITQGARNPLTYRAMAQHLSQVRHPPEVLGPTETMEQMLLSALSIDPLYVPAIEGLLAYYDQTGNHQQRYALLRNVVLPWMDLLTARDLEAARRYQVLLLDYANALDDAGLRTEMQLLAETLATRKPITERYWLFEPDG